MPEIDFSKIATRPASKSRRPNVPHARGVMWDRVHNRWSVTMWIGSHMLRVGTFPADQFLEAAAHYNAELKSRFPELGKRRLNPIEVLKARMENREDHP